MCGGGIFGGSGGSPSVTAAPTPTVAATAPPPETTAEAPVVNEGAKRQNQAQAQRKGTSALRIGLTLGGGMGGANGGGQGVSIPR